MNALTPVILERSGSLGNAVLAMSVACKFSLTFIIICVGTLLVWWAVREPGPRYRGHPISYWLFRLESYDYEQQVEARRAFQEMGGIAVPYLIADLQREETTVQQKLEAYARRVPFLNHFLPPTYRLQFRHQCATQALGEIGPAASNAIPILQSNVGRTPQAMTLAAMMKIREEPLGPFFSSATNMNSPMWEFNVQVLTEFHEESKQLVPFLCELLSSTNSSLVAIGAEALGEIHSNPQIAIPALISATARLEKRNIALDHGLMECLDALGKFKHQAVPAIPILQQCLDNHPDWMIKWFALRSLSQTLPPDEARALLIKFTSDPNPNLQNVAKGLLKELDSH